MPWFKVDDGLHSHPKVLGVGLEAMGLWAMMGSYCSHYPGQRGRIPRAAVERATSTRRALERLTLSLVQAGLWLVDGDGWRFNDWDHYQPTPEAIEAERQRKAESGRLGGLAKAKQAASRQASGNVAAASGPAVARPVPSRPDLEKQKPLSLSGPEGGPEEPDGSQVRLRAVVEEPAAWQTVHEHFLDARQAHNPKARRPAIDPRDRKSIAELVKAGYSPGDLCKSVNGMFRCPHNLGDNDRSTEYLALRIALKRDNVDRFIALAEATTAGHELPVLRLENRADFIPRPGDAPDVTGVFDTAVST